MVVAADTAALRKSALRQQPLARLICMPTAGAFVTLAYGISVDSFEQNMTDTPLRACCVYQKSVDISCPFSIFEMGQILGLP